MTTLRIGNDSSALVLDAAGPTDQLLARLELDGLRAERLVREHVSGGFDDLADFFASLDRDWQGWSGVRTWSSLESELEIRAGHDGHVQLDVVLRQFGTLQQYGPEPWTATAHLTLEAGEQLSKVAMACRQLADKAAGRR